MSNEHYTQFRAANHFNEPLLINQLEQNLKSWVDWSLLKIGAWENVTTGTSGTYGGSFSILQKVNDPSYTANTVFQGIRKDWVWESGVDYSSPTGGTFNPLPVQVYVNNTLVNTGTSSHVHYIDYPNGRVVFTQTHSTQTIKAQYSYRSVQTYLSDDINWWFEVQFDSQNPADQQWAQNLTSGDFNLSSTNRTQLPAIVIEGVPQGTSSAFELGTLVGKNKQDVLFHIICQDRYTRNNLADILRLQKGKTIILYDNYKIYTNQLFPLDERGMKVTNPTIYPDIVNNSTLVFRHAVIEDINISNIETKHPNLHWAVARATLEIIY